MTYLWMDMPQALHLLPIERLPDSINRPGITLALRFMLAGYHQRALDRSDGMEGRAR